MKNLAGLQQCYKDIYLTVTYNRERSIIWALRATQQLPEAGDFQRPQSFSPQSHKDNWMPNIRAQRQSRASYQNSALDLSTVQCTVPRAPLIQVTAIMKAGCWQGLCSPGLSRAVYLSSVFKEKKKRKSSGNEELCKKQNVSQDAGKYSHLQKKCCSLPYAINEDVTNFSLCSKRFCFPISQLTAINRIYFPSHYFVNNQHFLQIV